MKKFLFSIFLVSTYILLFSNSVFAVGESAENDNGNGYAYVTTINYASPDSASYTAIIYSNYKICLLNDGGQYFKYVCAGDLVENNRCGQLEFYSGNNTVSLLNTGSVGTCLALTSNNNGTPLWNWSGLITPEFHEKYNPDMPVFSTWEECFDYSISNDIEFVLSEMENDFSISAPTLIVEDILLDTNDQYKVPYKVNFYDHAWDDEESEPTPLYLYMMVRYWTPLSVNGLTKNGFQYWNVNKYKASTGYVLNTYELGEPLPSNGASEFVMQDVDEFHDGWEEFRSGITTEFTGEYDQTHKSLWNEYARNAGIYGNRVEIYCCYFKEVEGVFYSGLWTHWISDQPEQISVQQVGQVGQNNGKETNGTSSVIMPNNAKENVEATDPNMPANIPNNATNVNVTINNPSVPNNMNYPTITSYNHDNMFTTFIGTYNNATQYLGGFAQFCNSVLLWIPAEIWAIVGTGLAMAIIIMVVKIL